MIHQISGTFFGLDLVTDSKALIDAVELEHSVVIGAAMEAYA
jgi:hypothetical protein